MSDSLLRIVQAQKVGIYRKFQIHCNKSDMMNATQFYWFISSSSDAYLDMFGFAFKSFREIVFVIEKPDNIYICGIGIQC